MNEASYSSKEDTTVRDVQRVLLLFAVVTLLIAEHVSAQSWYNISWSNRRAVTVTNTNSQALTNFQVRVKLDNTFSFSKAQSGGRDLRVTAADGTTLIPFWVETWAPDTSASIWVKVPSIAANASATVYLYYGNSAATGVASGDNTFDFFDDFTITTAKQGYYSLSEPATYLVNPYQEWEDGGVPHTLSIVDWEHDGYRYWGYYGLVGWPAGAPIGLKRSNDLLNWTKYEGNPIIAGAAANARWASVVLVDNVLQIFYSIYTAADGSTSIVRDNSADGILFSGSTVTVVTSGVDYSVGNPSIWLNPNDGLYYLYWVQIYDSGVHQIMVRSASTIAGLDTAPTVTVVTSQTTFAAPNMMYRDGTYFLSVERRPNSVWQTDVWTSTTSPISGFSPMAGNPIIIGACNFQHIFGNTLYAIYAKESWTMEYRTADLTLGRKVAPIPSEAKWITRNGEWNIFTATQQNGVDGNVGQANPASDQMLGASFTGTDYVVEANGRHGRGRVWGLGFRSTDQNNLFSLNLYEDLDETNNLYLYDWVEGSASTLGTAGVGTIDASAWHKMSVKVHGTTFDAYVDDVQRITNATSSHHTSGYVALFAEGGSNAQFDDMRVRKYASVDPSSSVGAEEVPSGVVESVTCSTVGTNYSFAYSKVAAAFSTLPSGGGSVAMRRHLDAPSQPAYPLTPDSSSFIPVWYEISSTMPENSFKATFTIDVSNIAGFGSSTKLMYYSALTGRWVLMSSVYSSITNTVTFSTTHLGVFAFFNTTATTYDVVLCANPADLASRSVYPNNSWGNGYPGRTNDWGYPGNTPFSVYITPPDGMQLGACTMTLQWDSTVVDLSAVSFTGSLFSGPDLLSAMNDRLGTHDRVTIAASMSGTNVTATTGSYIARLDFTLKAPGHSTIAIIGDQVRRFIPGSSPVKMLTIPQQADLKAYLGDVAASGLVVSHGDGSIDFEDLAAWSVSYWAGVDGQSLDYYQRKFDIGPTANHYIFSLPVQDNMIDFEDLVIFSIGFGQSVRHELPKVAPQVDPARLVLGAPVVLGEETTIPVSLKGGVTDLRGLSMTLAGQCGQLIAAEPGSLLKSYDNRAAILKRQADGKVHVDVALLGLDKEAINSEGELLTLRFRGDANLFVQNVQGRTSNNTALTFASAGTSNQAAPTRYDLKQNYPNPFNPSTTIGYQLPEAGFVKLEVFNVLGRKVATLVDQSQQAGCYTVTWNGRDIDNLPVASGVYMFRLSSGQFTSVKRMLLVK
jgi:hypothetical protein